MFYSFCSNRPDRPSGDRLTLARAFALVGVLRNIDERLPLDMILVYLSENDNSGLMRTIVDLVDCSPRSVRGIASWAEDFIPASVRKMAKNYLIRSFWWNVADVKSLCTSYAEEATEKGCRRSLYYTRTYPAAILKALDSMVITNGAELVEIKDTIDVFHATVVNCGRSGTAISSNYADMTLPKNECIVPSNIEQDHYASMNRNQRETFDRLYWTFEKYCDRCRNNLVLPNQFEINTVCNMLDIILIMRGIADSRTALRIKNVYEYAKMSRIASNQLAYDRRMIRSVNSGWTIGGSDFVYGDASVPSDYERFMKMTPHAIICSGLKAPLNFYCQYESIELIPYSYGTWMINRVLDNNTRPLLEVELYTIKEMEIRRNVIVELQRKWEKDHPEGNDDAECAPIAEECPGNSAVGGV